MSEDLERRVLESYRRFCFEEKFFDDFYDTFLGKSEEVARAFKDTDFTKQKKALSFSLNYLVMYSCHPDFELAQDEIHRIAVIHDREHLNVKPELYEVWLESLLSTISKHDPQCNEDLLNDWKICVQPAIDYMRSKY